MIPVTEVPLQHDEREWCRMLSSQHALSPSVVSCLLDDLDRQATLAGMPLERTYVRRQNAEGEGIGPETRISNQAGYFLAYACEQVRDAIDKSVTKMLGVPA